MKQYNYTSKEYPARLRSQRSQQIAATGNSGGLSVIPGNPNPVPSVTDHSQLSGIVSTADETYSDFARDIHLSSTHADALKRLSTLEIIKMEDLTIETDDNVYSAARAKKEHDKKTEADEKKFIRKDKPDETEHRVDFKDGTTFGEYVGGFTGDGAIIDKDGNAEMTSLKVRDFLEVPELRFNRIDVVSGELWNAIAFGLIESVDEANRTVTLRLEEGELSGLHLNDFCRGIFHNLTDNETAPGTDSSGFDVMPGFRTSYFTPVEIIDNATFRYELKAGSSVHPCKAMKFAVYGNPTDKNRQSSAYHTRTYTRYLRGVSTWKIEEKHISMQLGDLTNLIINGERLEEGSVYLNNVYFGGNVWYTREQQESMKGKDAYSVTLTTYNAVYNKADSIYNQADVVSGDKTVTTGANVVVASNFTISTRLQVSKGPVPLRYSEVIGEGKYVVSSVGSGCKYIIADGLVAVKEVTEDKAEIKLEVNCEGMATYEVVFTIVRVVDGVDGKDVEFIFTRTATATKPGTPASSQTDDYVPQGWTDDPVGPTISIPYEWVCKRIKRNEVWSDYSAPSLWVKYGFDGQPGAPGSDGTSEYTVYRRSASQPDTPKGSIISLSGWALDPPPGNEPLWASKAVFNSNGTLSRNWSVPVKITGDAGAAGKQGPTTTFRGEYSSSKQYTGSSERIEIVFVIQSDKSYRYYYTLVTAGVFSNVHPTNTKKWSPFQGQFENLATGFAYIKDANIASWRFKEGYIESQNGNVVLDGNANDGPRIAIGASYVNRNMAPFRAYEDGNIFFQSGQIGPWTISSNSCKYVNSTFNEAAKLYIGNIEKGNPDSVGARITALGVDVNFYVSNSTSLTTDIKNIIVDNVSTSDKKTSLLVKTSGGAKNTAMAVYGNLTVTGDIAFIGIPVSNTLPNQTIGFDHQTCIISSATTLTLPTGESIRGWFGENPNAWKDYGVIKTGGQDGTVYDLYVTVAYWHTSNCTIFGNSGGNSDFADISGTPLYGVGVNRTGYGQITLQPGRSAHFKKIGRVWYCVEAN